MQHYLDDTSLLMAIKSGEENGVRFVYDQYFTYSVSWVYGNNGSEEDAREIFQEAVIVLIHNIREGKFRAESKVKTYLFGICKRLWLKELKRKGRLFSLENDERVEEAAIFELHEQTMDKFSKMESVLSSLGGKCESIIRKYYLLKESMASIAESMSYSNANNVKNQKYKCLQRLKKLYFE